MCAKTMHPKTINKTENPSKDALDKTENSGLLEKGKLFDNSRLFDNSGPFG